MAPHPPAAARRGAALAVEPSGARWRALEASEAAPTPAEPAARGLPWLAMASVVLAIGVAGLALVFATRTEPAIEVEGALVDGSDEVGGSPPSSSVAFLVVEVGGAVVDPGVYRLSPGSRIGDAVIAAGGFGPRVDAGLADRLLNLAAPLHDGDEVHVPVRGEATTSNGGASGGGTAGEVTAGPIDLNRATADELDTLPGVGPVTVAKIIAAREEQPFASIDELGTRKVVGSATLEKIRALVTVGP
jgi:competence protein ComEA